MRTGKLDGRGGFTGAGTSWLHVMEGNIAVQSDCRVPASKDESSDSCARRGSVQSPLQGGAESSAAPRWKRGRLKSAGVLPAADLLLTCAGLLACAGLRLPGRRVCLGD